MHLLKCEVKGIMDLDYYGKENAHFMPNCIAYWVDNRGGGGIDRSILASRV